MNKTELNMDTYLYIKGKYEPIISEEQWDRCKERREQKKRHCHYLTQNGEVRKESGIYSSKDIWSKKLSVVVVIECVGINGIKTKVAKLFMVISAIIN